MCPKKQFYHHKNVWTVSIVKFEFPGYNDDSFQNSCSKLLQLEVYRLRLCRHPNIISLVTAFVQESSVVLVFPEQSLSSVSDLIEAGGGTDRQHF